MSERHKNRIKIGRTQQKVLLALLTGAALVLSSSPLRQWKILRGFKKEWRNINEQNLKRSIKELYTSKLLHESQDNEGNITLVLSDQGKERALRFSLDTLAIKRPKKWDGRWRLVLFDIPERQKKLRDVFRGHLQRMGFYEFQKSVFVYPYPCNDELDFLIEFHNARKYVRTIIAESIDNEQHLLQYFDL